MVYVENEAAQIIARTANGMKEVKEAAWWRGKVRARIGLIRQRDLGKVQIKGSTRPPSHCKLLKLTVGLIKFLKRRIKIYLK